MIQETHIKNLVDAILNNPSSKNVASVSLEYYQTVHQPDEIEKNLKII